MIAARPIDWVTTLADARDLLMPEVILVAFGCLALLVGRRAWAVWSALVGVGLAAASTLAIESVFGAALPRRGFFATVVIDEFALAVKWLVLGALGFSIALSARSPERDERGEVFALMLFAAVGMMLVASGNDLLTLYLGLEVTALALSVLVAWPLRSRFSTEAGLKCFLAGAFSSAVLVYGMSLLYGAAGSTNLGDIAARIPAVAETPAGGLLAFAAALVAAGVLVRVAAVPFHMWAPDVGEGAPAPVAAFLSVGARAAGFAVLVRLFLEALAPLRAPAGRAGWAASLGAVAAVTAAVGAAGAAGQDSVRRLLAFAAIGNTGFLIAGLVSGERAGYTGFAVLLVVSAAASMGAFGVLVALGRESDGRDADRFEAFDGLGVRAPGLAAVMAISLAGLAGLPPTAGFVGRAYVVYGLVRGGAWSIVLAAIALAATLLSAYYYLRIVRAMYTNAAPEGARRPAVSWPTRIAVALAAALTLGPGVYPQPAVAFAERAVERFKPARPAAAVAGPGGGGIDER